MKNSLLYHQFPTQLKESCFNFRVVAGIHCLYSEKYLIKNYFNLYYHDCGVTTRRCIWHY
jgi:hypothetical protein